VKIWFVQFLIGLATYEEQISSVLRASDMIFLPNFIFTVY